MTVHKISVIGDLNSDQNNQQPFFSSAAAWSLQKEVYGRGSQLFFTRVPIPCDISRASESLAITLPFNYSCFSRPSWMAQAHNYFTASINVTGQLNLSHSV